MPPPSPECGLEWNGTAEGAGYENAVGHDRVEGLRPDSNAWRMGPGFVGETWGLRDSRAWLNVVGLCLERPSLVGVLRPDELEKMVRPW
ncbi:hypothetical protein L3X38_032034 [Prunus dulcis]|uniref:Uncharacterized protein n=1 Tax=Prunus dulcis TaxID=3755 RepID=A0AAD4VEU8_PRUDU|nr:hypothetical protein L3X38_032034 [Prunus dulcis]